MLTNITCITYWLCCSLCNLENLEVWFPFISRHYYM